MHWTRWPLGLYTLLLLLAFQTDGLGAAGQWKVLEKTWELVGDPLAFRDYVNRETKAFLAEVR